MIFVDNTYKYDSSQNSKVAIKVIPRNKVEISRPLLLELKRVSTSFHEETFRICNEQKEQAKKFVNNIDWSFLILNYNCWQQ